MQQQQKPQHETFQVGNLEELLNRYKKLSPKELKEQYQENLKNKNERFEQLSDAQKRMAIAEDVIAQLAIENYVSTPGTYVNTVFMPESQGCDIVHAPLDSAIDEGQIKCSVCARGALFMSQLRKYGQMGQMKVHNTSDYCFAYGNDDDDYQGTAELAKLFSKEQQGLMETAFEGRHFGPLEVPQIDRCFKFYQAANNEFKTLSLDKQLYYGGPDNYRLLKICENIIDNKGTFKP